MKSIKPLGIGSFEELIDYAKANDDCLPAGFLDMLNEPILVDVIKSNFSQGIGIKQVQNAGYSPITGITSIILVLEGKVIKDETGILILCDRTRKVRSVIDKFEVAPAVSEKDVLDVVPLTIESLLSSPPTIDKDAHDVYMKKLKNFWERLGMPNGIESGEANTSTYECTGGVPTGYPTGCTRDTKVDKDCSGDTDYEAIF